MLIRNIDEAVSLGDKVIVLSKSPSTVKSIYDIELENKDLPTKNRKDKRFNYYYDKIWNDLHEDV